MKIRGLRYDDDGDPIEFDVVLTAKQIGIIYALVGNLSEVALSKLEGSRFTDDFFDLVELANEMNRHYDNGVHEVMPQTLAKVINDINQTIVDPLP